MPNIIGTNSADILIGTQESDRVLGRAGDDTLIGSAGSDRLLGQGGNDELISYSGNDSLRGGGGDDRFELWDGNDTAIGGRGDDIFLSFSDAGEPEPAQGGSHVNDGIEPILDVNDIIIGGPGADYFGFFPLLDAKQEIIEQHVDEVGNIDWEGVAGENNGVHDHWLNSIGTDYILDYQADQDAIAVIGHTVYVNVTQKIDANAIAYSEIEVYSDQGNDGISGGGSHDLDALGIINVYGDPVVEGDVIIDPGVFYGQYSNISGYDNV